jgi:hypothetical protein
MYTYIICVHTYAHMNTYFGVIYTCVHQCIPVCMYTVFKLLSKQVLCFIYLHGFLSPRWSLADKVGTAKEWGDYHWSHARMAS